MQIKTLLYVVFTIQTIVNVENPRAYCLSHPWIPFLFQLPVLSKLIFFHIVNFFSELVIFKVLDL